MFRKLKYLLNSLTCPKEIKTAEKKEQSSVLIWEIKVVSSKCFLTSQHMNNNHWSILEKQNNASENRAWISENRDSREGPKRGCGHLGRCRLALWVTDMKAGLLQVKRWYKYYVDESVYKLCIKIINGKTTMVE